MGVAFRHIAIVFCALGAVYNGASAVFLTRISDASTPLPLDVSLYVYFATAVSLLGLYGVIKNHAYTLSIFANFLILDTLVCALPRFALLYLVYNVRDLFCDYDASPPNAISFSQLLPARPNGIHPVYDPAAGTIDEKCSSVFSIGVTILVVGVVAATLVQMFFAVRVKQWANRLLEENEAPADEEAPPAYDEKEAIFVVPAPVDEKAEARKWGSDDDISYTYGDLEN